ncbi:polysaccharide deacetylase family protein [Clostridium perfringens]|uniref:Polysaccharide deacetylase family protein n=1 Tax=Clostridium perfringens D str. JGS1721 TaxID=488537 RepID=B1V107_CLOPF|nr:polysaccharide deacetylase family protein [Clostridium perfringens]EDT72529.1 polysaccharide deacetylase family protein [Clostridium perfringens D str. JGS1721]ELC8385622.1 polysaccharide deacetylase [Clostridium perfringens]ELC8406967.1 polysaccharide deacetylase [Clostridium perfringens]MBO3361519.1 polysaccharide deacetylase [Clostridium perfringens]PWX08033.1 polysaccharide deacetylase [Clostridium perfringens]
MSKETLSKRKKKNLEKKYIRRRIGVVLIAIVALVFLGTRIALNHKVEVAKGNTGDEGENKELVMEEATVELPQYKSTDIVPGRNVTFDGKNYAVNVKDVGKMVEGSYEGNEKYVFLTFDDGPSPLTEQVLDILKNENVKGTFFMLGSRLDSGQAPKESLKRAIEEGNAIANHSYSHNFKKLYPGNITDVNYFMDEFKRTNDIMRDVLGVEFDTNVLRMPGGYNSRVYYKDRNLEELNNNLESNRIVSIDWNALNGDAEGKPYTLNEMIDYVKRTSKGKNQVVLLMHDTFGKEKTVKILPEIIKYYKEEGYEFKTISDANV